jgi:peroxiredoxin
MNQSFSRRLSTTALSLSLFVAVHGQQKFIINGEVEAARDGMVIRFSNYQDRSKDSAIVKNGKFHFEGNIKQPGKAYISIDPMRKQSPVPGSVMDMVDGQTFFISEGVTTISGKNLTSAVIDNPVEKEYVELNARKKPYEEQINGLRSHIYLSKDKDSARALKTELKAVDKRLFQTELTFVKEHPDSYVSFNAFDDRSFVIEDVVGCQEMYDALSDKFKHSEEGVKKAEAIAIAKKVAIGQSAITFAQNDVNGNPISLSSLKGKYVLVDFWASWCGPCRMEYPYLHKAYDKYKGKNFEILGVSLDDKKDAWTKSIKENDFQWLLVCDLKGFKNEVALAYGVHAIPQSFLLDPQGIIIARNLRGEDLIEKLDEVIKP